MRGGVGEPDPVGEVADAELRPIDEERCEQSRLRFRSEDRSEKWRLDSHVSDTIIDYTDSKGLNSVDAAPKVQAWAAVSRGGLYMNSILMPLSSSRNEP